MEIKEKSNDAVTLTHVCGYKHTFNLSDIHALVVEEKHGQPTKYGVDLCFEKRFYITEEDYNEIKVCRAKYKVLRSK